VARQIVDRVAGGGAQRRTYDDGARGSIRWDDEQDKGNESAICTEKIQTGDGKLRPVWGPEELRLTELEALTSLSETGLHIGIGEVGGERDTPGHRTARRCNEIDGGWAGIAGG
jgi:hypothetical protein